MLDATSPTSAEQIAQQALPFQNILAATDGGHTGTRAVELAAQLAMLCHAKLAVIHVVDTLTGFAPQFAWGPGTYEAEYLSHGQAMLDALLKKLPASLQVTRILRGGDPGIEISRAAKQFGADLLIIGGPSHHRLGRLLLGSVDEALLDQAHCPILVIPPDAVAKEVKLHTAVDDYD